MAYLAAQLVTEAWYLSQIVARKLDTVDGEQATDGLMLLNELLTLKNIAIKEIPYNTHHPFQVTPGQETYFIEDLREPEVVTFTLNNVRFAMWLKNRQAFLGDSRIEDLKTLPNTWYYEQVNGGCTLYLYALPDKAYDFKVVGRFSLSQVTGETDLDLLWDKFYSVYLKYELAREMCAYYDYPIPDFVARKFGMLENKIKTLNPIDYTPKTAKILSGGGYVNFIQANLGRGWYPS